MRWSDERILTTHTGSLPRPPELTRLYVRRARGEAIDRAELDRVGKAALRRIVDKQIEAGVDIGNNGEQQREAFFLCRYQQDDRHQGQHQPADRLRRDPDDGNWTTKDRLVRSTMPTLRRSWWEMVETVVSRISSSPI